MKATVIITAALAASSAVLAFAGYTPPEIKQQCGICHASHKMGDVGLLLEPLSGLCIGCHTHRAGSEHAVDVVPSMRVRGLPLYGGRMTCATCHDPHGRSGFDKMLRLRPGEICNHCHEL